MTEPALGIDIAKLKFNVCLINQNGKLKHKVFTNSATGFEQLKEWLSKQGVERVHACLEATGTDGEALSLCLHQTGHRDGDGQPGSHQSLCRESTLTHHNRSC